MLCIWVIIFNNVAELFLKSNRLTTIVLIQITLAKADEFNKPISNNKIWQYKQSSKTKYYMTRHA